MKLSITQMRLLIIGLVLSLFAAIYDCYFSPDLQGGHYFLWVCVLQFLLYFSGCYFMTLLRLEAI